MKQYPILIAALVLVLGLSTEATYWAYPRYYNSYYHAPYWAHSHLGHWGHVKGKGLGVAVAPVKGVAVAPVKGVPVAPIVPVAPVAPVASVVPVAPVASVVPVVHGKGKGLAVPVAPLVHGKGAPVVAHSAYSMKTHYMPLVTKTHAYYHKKAAPMPVPVPVVHKKTVHAEPAVLPTKGKAVPVPVAEEVVYDGKAELVPPVPAGEFSRSYLDYHAQAVEPIVPAPMIDEPMKRVPRDVAGYQTVRPLRELVDALP
ncbi:A kinase (PRKA) anchor protein 14 [Cichlidogyrus casuarinus]|uniref:A kinase (PRKA) anchor protein 14 n=1 Tax=Cichlidogyrus casuarinus TaxID=1844966 RepID=A0ABD2QNG5_9PLAT